MWLQFGECLELAGRLEDAEEAFKQVSSTRTFGLHTLSFVRLKVIKKGSAVVRLKGHYCNKRGRIKSTNLLRCLRTQCLMLVLRQLVPAFSIDTLFLFGIEEYRRGY